MNENPMPQEGAAPKKKPIKLILGLLVILVAVAAVVFVMTRQEPEPPAPPATEPPITEASEVPVETGATEPTMLEHMAALYAQNADIVGWIRIDDTKLDYPVMYTPDDEEKYLHANFEGKVDYAGLPFIDKDCTVDPESQNLILYGHNMKNGTAFKTIMSYENEKFWEEHPTIYYSTLYEERTYEVIAAFRDRVYEKTEDCFKFYQFIDPATEEEFNGAISYFKENTSYDIEATAEYGDHLITLVTCAYHTRRGRFVVVAREITQPAEAETVTG